MNALIIDKKKILIAVISLQLALSGIIFFNDLGLNIPILRSVIVIIYLTFVPGMLVLKVLKLDKYLDNLTEGILLSVGLSVSSLIFLGVFLNFLYPLVGINRPFSELPLTFGISIFIILLIILSSFMDSNKVYFTSFDFRPHYLFALLLPFLSVFGVYMLNYQNDNTLLLVLFGIIALIPLLVCLGKIEEQYYSFLIWVMSISMLIYGTLTRTVLEETYMPGVIKITGIWNPNWKAGHNTLLPNVILHPIFIVLSNMNFLLEPKIIQPIISSTIPVLLYQIFRRQVSANIAFLATFLFIAMFPFYNVFTFSIRVPMALFFLCFLEYLLIDNNLHYFQRRILIALFSFLLITSHYGTSYIFMIVLVSVLILRIFIEKVNKNTVWKVSNPFSSSYYILFYFILALGWYIYTSKANMFDDIVEFFYNVYLRILTEFTSPKQSLTLYALTTHYSLSIEILKILYIVVNIFVIIGLFSEIRWPRWFNKEYMLFSIIFSLVILSTYLPTKHYNPTRIILLSYTFLAPFFVLGGITFISYVAKTIRIEYVKNLYENRNILKIIGAFLMIFFLFNSGFISETITKDRAPGAIISKKRIMDENNTCDKIFLYMRYTPLRDILASSWITKYGNPLEKIYSDFLTWENGLRYRNDYLPEYGIIPGNEIKPMYARLVKNAEIKSGNYIFLGYHNTKEGFIVVQFVPLKYFNTSYITPLIKSSSRIYTNSGSEIYLKE